MQGTILVTGASGNVGRAAVTALLERGFELRQAGRDPARLRADVPWVRLDYCDPASVGPAVSGVDGLFLVAPPLDPEAPAKLKPIIEKAKAAGVRHVVFISALGVNYNEQAPLRIVERMVMDSGISWTVLRPNFFMENFSHGFLSAPIREQGGIFLAAGRGKTSFIACEDIAAVAAEAFRQDLAGRELDLTGPEALDHYEVAGILSEVTGRTITYHELTEEQMLEGARRSGMPESAVQYLAVLYGAVRAGHAAVITSAVEEVTGRKPLTFRQFAEKNRECWQARA